ncbi:uncharacterized protein N7473_003546 [Penicillium subrubescens]|uniref:uncharacterized protein n=1 Tax=Penicillium subrubescens TaxID=1316194 RepID=UPI0025450CA2|nr:uncharacterized protein N7473_003546 [Penicillium subrubescens]KAJ5906630.1 hypothetical protein N7473_003546 [Penicillium subrubescens]
MSGFVEYWIVSSIWHFHPRNSQAWLSAVRGRDHAIGQFSIFGAQFSSEQIPAAMLIEWTMALMEIVGFGCA